MRKKKPSEAFEAMKEALETQAVIFAVRLAKKEKAAITFDFRENEDENEEHVCSWCDVFYESPLPVAFWCRVCGALKQDEVVHKPQWSVEE